MDISKKAMLVSLTIKTWSPSKKTSAELIETDASAKQGTVTARKHLLGGNCNRHAAKLTAIRKVADAARKEIYAQTLPWGQGGERILLLRNMQKFDRSMSKLEAEFDSVTRLFVNAYPSACKEAQLHLGDLFNPEDFPTEIAGKYTFEVTKGHISQGSDFRLDIADEELAELRQNLDSQNTSRVKVAMQDAYGKLQKEVTAISDYFVRESKGGKVRFHDSLGENLERIIATIPDLNLTNDPELTKLAQEAKQSLSGLSSKTVQSMDKTAKSKMSEKAKKIAAKTADMAGAFGAQNAA